MKTSQFSLWKAHLVCWLLLAITGCRSSSPTLSRLAIPPAENLTGQEQLEWLSRATRTFFQFALQTAQQTYAFPLRSYRSPAAKHATHLLYVWFSRATNDQLLFNFELRDEIQQKTIWHKEIRAGLDPTLLREFSEVARQIDRAARTLAIDNLMALQLYTEATAGGSQEGKLVELLQQVLQLAPGFAEARLQLALEMARAGDTATAEQLLHEGLQQSALQLFDQLRFELVLAQLQGDLEKQQHILEQLIGYAPVNLEFKNQLAMIQLRSRQFEEAARYFQEAAEIWPYSPSLWNNLAYARCYQGNLDAALEALKHYRALDPYGPNASDTLGDVYFYHGSFDQAADAYLEAFQKDPEFLQSYPLLKAAFARLMKGEFEIADQLFHRYWRLRREANDPFAPLRRAQWLLLTGRANNAIELLQTLYKSPTNPVQQRVLAAVQYSICLSLSGHREQGRQLARLASSWTQDPNLKRICLTAHLLSLEPAPVEKWQARASAAFSGPAQARYRDLVLSYALFAHGYFRETLETLARLIRQTPPESTEPIDWLYGWCLLRTGQLEAAKKFLTVNPVNQLAGGNLLTILVFPEIFSWRSELYQQLNKPGVARQNLELYQQLKTTSEEATHAGGARN